MSGKERKWTDADITELTGKLIKGVQEQKHNFWIEPEQHYKDHARMNTFSDEQIRSMHDIIKSYRAARGLFWKAFLGFAVIGAFTLALFGVGLKQ